jgi:hypothetical protein
MGAGSDDPILVLDLLTDDDPNNDMGSNDVQKMVRGLHPEMKRALREAVLETRSMVKKLAAEQGLDLSGLSPGHIKEDIQRLQKESDAAAFEMPAKIRSAVAGKRAETRQKTSKLYDDFLGQSDADFRSFEQDMEK